MTAQPFIFRLPIQDFDLTLLPAHARAIGSEAFKDAVVAHFVEQYAQGPQAAIVTVDDTDISVVQLPAGSEPLDFVLTLLQAGRIAEAVPFLESMTKSDPANAQILYNLGISYSELAQFDEAIIRLKRAVQVEPRYVHAWIGIGVAYQRLRKPEQALEALQQAVALAPGDGFALRNLGAVLMSLDRADEALPLFRRARQALPHDPQTTYALAAALAETGRSEDADEADELFKVVIERWPSSEIAERSRTARAKTAQTKLREAVGGRLRPDVVMYIADALDTFDKVGTTKIREIAFEVAMKGQEGLDINDSTQRYTLTTLPGNFSALNLVAIMYAGFKVLDPALDAGIDFKAEYDAAQAMRRPE
jgi:tetratricopeptide (TPR) repeat protein